MDFGQLSNIAPTPEPGSIAEEKDRKKKTVPFSGELTQVNTSRKSAAS